MTTPAVIHAEVTARLARAGCVAPDEEATEMLAGGPDRAALEAAVCRREQGEPLAWITGRVDFCGHGLRAEAGVYVPRFQTEELARRAALLLPANGCAVDLCTGTGVVAAHLKRSVPTATVIGVDLDARAVAVARGNGVLGIVGDLAAPLRERHAVDVVTAVAPYVPTDHMKFLPADVQRHEPRGALDGGPDGLVVVRRVVAASTGLLRPGGWLLVELGGDQDAALAADLRAHGFAEWASWHDDDGDLRGVVARATVRR